MQTDCDGKEKDVLEEVMSERNLHNKKPKKPSWILYIKSTKDKM